MRRLAPLLVACVVVCVAACAAPRSPDAAGRPLTVFAAASLQGPLDTVAARWSRRSGRRVAVSYAGSAALARQIAEGAPADVFVSADRQWMDWLAERHRIDAATRFDLAGNTLVLVAPRAAATPAASAEALLPDGLGADGRLAVADPDHVPAGRYAKQALQTIGRWDAVVDRLASADDVRTALAFVARGEAPLGIVYATDANAEPDVRVVARFPPAAHASIVYPAAAVSAATTDPAGDDRSGGRDAAAFLAYLRSDDAWGTFAAAGFVRPAAGR